MRIMEAIKVFKKSCKAPRRRNVKGKVGSFKEPKLLRILLLVRAKRLEKVLK